MQVDVCQERTEYSPYKVANFFFEVRIVRVRIDPKHDIDLIPGYFHPLHQGPDAIPLARPVGCLQSAVDFGRKIFESANNQLSFRLQGRLIRPRLTLLFQAGEALTEADNPGLELVLVDEALCIAVTERPPAKSWRVQKLSADLTAD